MWLRSAHPCFFPSPPIKSHHWLLYEEGALEAAAVLSLPSYQRTAGGTEWRVLAAPLPVTLPDYESKEVKATKASSAHTIPTADRKSPGKTSVKYNSDSGKVVLVQTGTCNYCQSCSATSCSDHTQSVQLINDLHHTDLRAAGQAWGISEHLTLFPPLSRTTKRGGKGKATPNAFCSAIRVPSGSSNSGWLATAPTAS